MSLKIKLKLHINKSKIFTKNIQKHLLKMSKIVKLKVINS